MNQVICLVQLKFKSMRKYKKRENTLHLSTISDIYSGFGSATEMEREMADRLQSVGVTFWEFECNGKVYD